MHATRPTKNKLNQDEIDAFNIVCLEKDDLNEQLQQFLKLTKVNLKEFYSQENTSKVEVIEHCSLVEEDEIRKELIEGLYSLLANSEKERFNKQSLESGQILEIGNDN